MIVWSLIPQDSLAGGTPRRVTHRFTGGHGCRASGWEHQIERDMRQVHSSPGSDGLRLARRFTHDLEAETSWHPAPAAGRADWPSLVVLSVPGGKVVAGDPDLKSSSDRHRVTTRQTSRPSIGRGKADAPCIVAGAGFSPELRVALSSTTHAAGSGATTPGKVKRLPGRLFCLSLVLVRQVVISRMSAIRRHLPSTSDAQSRR